jgi:hypothetical protein
MSVSVKLSTLVVVRDNPKERTSWKQPHKLSDVTVRFGPVTVARATLGGVYDEFAALATFQRAPKRFTPVNEELFKSLTGGK